MSLGLRANSDEVYVGTPKGVMRARSFKRMPPSAQADKTLFAEVKGVTWDPVPGSMDGEVPVAKVRIQADTVVPDAALPPVVDTRGAPGTRHRVHLRRDVELVRYGYTPGCPGCIAAAVGGRGHWAGACLFIRGAGSPGIRTLR